MSKDRAAQLVEAGIWLKLSGDAEGALKLFQRALKLDPENEKARQLLASVPAPGGPPPVAPEAPPVAPEPPPVAPEPPPVAPEPPPEVEAPREVEALPAPPSLEPEPLGAAASNPFERPAEVRQPSAAEVGWGLATGFAPNPAAPTAAAPAPPQVNLDDDWGRFTGASTPVPASPTPIAPEQVPAVVPVSSDSGARLGVAGPEVAAPRHTMVQFQVPTQPSPRHTMVQFQVPEAPPAPRNTMVQFSVGELPEAPRAPRNTMVEFPAGSLPPPPAAPRSTLADFSLPPVGAAPLELEPAASAEGASSSPLIFDVAAEPLPPVAEVAPAGAPTEVPFESEPPAEAAPRPITGMWGPPVAEANPVTPVAPPAAPPSEDAWRFSDSGVSAAPVGWEVLAPPQPEPRPSAPVLAAVDELEPSAQAMGVPVPPPPVADPPAWTSPPVFAVSPVPAPPPALESPPPTASPMFATVPPPAPSAPEAGGVQRDLASRDALFGSPASAPVPSPPEPAWAWSTAAPPPDVTPAEWAAPPEPRPSPSLAPAAESAWDQRSNPGVKLPVVPGRDRALDLISSDSKISRPPEARTEELQAILRSARNLLGLDDHTGAMELIVKAQALAPDDLEVQVLRERSERTLLTMLESKLGPLGATPRVMLKDDEIIWLNLDHRAGFVLAQIDGAVTFEDLFSVSGMARLDTARILAQLVDEGVISRG